MRIAFFLSLLLAGAAHAQDPAAGYPNKTIRIFGQGTGSTADYLSRYIAQKLSERWGQPVIVDSRAGAGGTIPTDIVAKSPPDGYNLVMGHAGPFVSAVTLYAKTATTKSSQAISRSRSICRAIQRTTGCSAKTASKTRCNSSA